MMEQPNLSIPEETKRSLRAYLAKGGRDESAFVDRAIRQTMFMETLEAVWEQNKDLSGEEAQRIADEALAEVRANRP